MTLKQLQYFMSVARSLSFTEAAQEQYISQSALSRSIASLEEELGVLLLERNRHTVQLTPAGNLLASELPDLRKALERVMLLVRQAENGVTGRLNIGVLEGQNVDEALQVTLKYFNQSVPMVKIAPSRLSYTELMDGIDRGELDIIMTMSYALRRREDLALLELESAPHCIVLPEDHRLADRTERPLEDFRHEDFILSGEADVSPETRFFKDCCLAAGFEPRCHMVPDARTKQLWIESGLGIALFNEQSRACGAQGLKTVRLTNVPPAKIVLAWKKDGRNPSVRLFVHMTSCCL